GAGPSGRAGLRALRHFLLQIRERNGAAAAILVTERHALAPDIHADHLLASERRLQRASLAREPLAGCDVRVVLVGEAAHEAPAAAGDLCRVERESLVLGELQADGLELAQPGRAAQLAAAATHATQECGLVTHTDLFELDARAERAGEVANELAEADAPLCREVDRQLGAAVLPLRFADLQLYARLQDLLARDATDPGLVLAQLNRARHLLRPCTAQHAPLRDRCGAAGGAARAFPLGHRARSRHPPEVLAAVSLHDHVIADADVLLGDVVLPAIPLEGYFNDCGHLMPHAPAGATSRQAPSDSYFC